MSTSSRIDATAVITATLVAGLGAAGVKIESLPIESIGIGADLLAGGFFTKHKIEHWLHGRKHTTTHTAKVTIATDGRRNVTWQR